jgi:hypothetical protein
MKTSDSSWNGSARAKRTIMPGGAGRRRVAAERGEFRTKRCSWSELAHPAMLARGANMTAGQRRARAVSGTPEHSTRGAVAAPRHRWMRCGAA